MKQFSSTCPKTDQKTDQMGNVNILGSLQKILDRHCAVIRAVHEVK